MCVCVRACVCVCVCVCCTRTHTHAMHACTCDVQGVGPSCVYCLPFLLLSLHRPWPLCMHLQACGLHLQACGRRRSPPPRQLGFPRSVLRPLGVHTGLPHGRMRPIPPLPLKLRLRPPAQPLQPLHSHPRQKSVGQTTVGVGSRQIGFPHSFPRPLSVHTGSPRDRPMWRAAHPSAACECIDTLMLIR